MEEEFNKMSNQELIDLYHESMHQSEIYNISQLVKKILLNSLYGAMGSPYFLYYAKEIAMGITCLGQVYINKAAHAKNEYISKVLKEDEVKDRRIYSDTDSVTGDSIIRVNDMDMTIADFYESLDRSEEREENGKYIKQVKDKTVKTSDNLLSDFNTPIIYAMKHPTEKEIWEVTVNGKTVKITEDHSLIFIRQGKLCKGSVKELKDGDLLLTYSEGNKQ